MASPVIAILTSGGDSQGMNAAVRAAVRVSYQKGVPIFGVSEGYEGLVEGKNKIRRMNWDDVGGILPKGGTILGSARSSRFRTREGRLQAALNLISAGINSLIVVGGDGSLTGADVFRQEWTSLVQELAENGSISKDTASQVGFLRIVGLVGSIDNDMVGTDHTIGSDSALHRIQEAVDAILSTAASHQRSFVVEVMGRNCGYLALVTSLVTGADWVFLPETPPTGNWIEDMCNNMKKGRELGKRSSLIILAEGAVDQEGRKISADDVCKALEEATGHETRTTILGHVQRGGTASAWDRVMSSLVGADAVEAIMTMGDESLMIGFESNSVVRRPLMEAVRNTQQLGKYLAACNFAKALEGRGEQYTQAWRTYRILARAGPHPPVPGARSLRVGILNAGAASPGMNTAVRVLVRLGIDKGHKMVGIRNGFVGLSKMDVKELNWMSVNGWAVQGGALLGSNRKDPSPLVEKIAEAIGKLQLDVLVMIGGYEGYAGVEMLQKESANYPALRIPMVCVPASISNNLPATEFSIGSDTALNNIIWAVDHIKQSAVSSQRVFIVETMGSYCGYLTVTSGVAGGAEEVYIHEEGVTLDRLRNDVQSCKDRFANDSKNVSLIIRNENANEAYSTEFMVKVFEEESDDLYDVRHCILGHIQQGGNPTPQDRYNATLLVLPVINFLQTVELGVASAVCTGFVANSITATKLEDAMATIDRKYRRPKEQWWYSLKSVADVLALSEPPNIEEVFKNIPASAAEHPGLRRTWTRDRVKF